MSEWIAWSGGECPVGEGEIIDARFRLDEGDNESVYECQRVKNTLGARWEHTGKSGDILAYRTRS